VARVYIRIESANKPGQGPTPGDEAAALRVANAIAEALEIDEEPAGRGRRRAKVTTLRGVTLRLDVAG